MALRKIFSIHRDYYCHLTNEMQKGEVLLVVEPHVDWKMPHFSNYQERNEFFKNILNILVKKLVDEKKMPEGSPLMFVFTEIKMEKNQYIIGLKQTNGAFQKIDVNDVRVDSPKQITSPKETKSPSSENLTFVSSRLISHVLQQGISRIPPSNLEATTLKKETRLTSIPEDRPLGINNTNSG